MCNNPIHFTDRSTTPGGIIWVMAFGILVMEVFLRSRINPSVSESGNIRCFFDHWYALGWSGYNRSANRYQSTSVAEFAVSANSCVNTSSCILPIRQILRCYYMELGFGDGNTSTTKNPSNVYDTWQVLYRKLICGWCFRAVSIRYSTRSPFFRSFAGC